jgi:hypothetical protein
MSVWTFTGGDPLSSRAAAIAFQLAADGPDLAVVEQQREDDFSLGPPEYESTQSFECPELQSGLLCFSFVGSASVNINPDNFNVTYGGQSANFVAYEVQETEIDVIHVVGYVRLGVSAELESNEFFMSVTGINSPNVLSGALELLFVEGIEQEENGVFYEAGTVDTFETPLELAIPDEPPFIFTAAAVGFFDEVTITQTADGYTQGAAQSGSNSSTQAMAWHTLTNDTSYNCECEVDPGARTLLSMRTELLRRAGYASQAANPPPGIAELFNSYLQSAQDYLWHRYKPLQTRRLFSWDLETGVRYYGFTDNLQQCAGRLSRSRIEGAWVQDPNNVWYPLIYGISPTFYTLDQNIGWPNFYEVRECIEVFPAPQGTGYKLWIKGNFELLPFSADEDLTTMDAGPVLNWAIGLAKSHKGDKDAGFPTPGRETGYYGMAIRAVKDLIASAHVNRRYIPGTAELPIPTPPVMTHFEP